MEQVLLCSKRKLVEADADDDSSGKELVYRSWYCLYRREEMSHDDDVIVVT